MRMSDWAEWPREPWRLEFLGDPFMQHSTFAYWSGRLAALATLLFAIFVGWRNLRRSKSPDRKLGLGLESSVGVLFGLTLVLVVRPMHQSQASVRASGYAKVAIGVREQLELVGTALGWLPYWFAGLTLVGMIALGARLREGGKLGSRRRGCLLASWIVVNAGGVVPLTQAIRRFVAEGDAYFSADRWDQRVYHGAPAMDASVVVWAAFSRFCWMTALAAVLLAIAVWNSRRQPASSVDRVRTKYALSGICWIASVFVWWMTWPLAGERVQPIPTDHCFANLGLGFLPPPSILGVAPDVAPDAPEVACGTARWDEGVKHYWLDGTAVETAEQAFSVLKYKRELWLQLYSRRPFPGKVRLRIEAACSMGQLRDVLPVLPRAGYPGVHVLLTHLITVHQPFFGELQGGRESALQISVGTSEVPCDPAALSTTVPSFGDVAQEVAKWLELRRRGEPLCVMVP
jgi:hypothetical protein